MSVFISGGCKNGKSSLAEAWTLSLPAPHYYVATMIPRDDEDRERIKLHRQARNGKGFITIECGHQVDSILAQVDTSGSFLIDSGTALLANEMFTPDGMHEDAGCDVAESLAHFVRQAPNTVIVCDDIFQDSGLYDEWTEMYRRELGRIGYSLAQICDHVIEVTSGLYISYKGERP